MEEKTALKYDAFISYRHAELDSFVAENIHHELEKFKLPKNLVKQRGKGAKTRIERVFRDRDELPISINLSDNITEALGNSEYLIVICTPRLKESMWCKSEIDNFITMNGRDKVLAVLAEGEPRESFPEQITKKEKTYVDANGKTVTEWVDVEPLAADVRGSSHKEIKKKIKEEVMRLAAAMFECNYDEIKQRHREQVMKRRISIALGVTAVSLVVGSVSAYQALTINSQSKKIKSQYNKIEEQYKQIEDQYTEIEEQYKKIESQYNENLVKQSEIVVSQSQIYLKEGNVDAAKKLIIDTYNSSNGKLPEEAESNLRYVAAEVMRCYDNGATLKPIANLKMESTISLMSASPDYKYLMAFDTLNNLSIWNMETLTQVYGAKTDFEGTKDYEQNNYFSSNGEFYYVGKNTVCKINCEKGEIDWSTEITGAKRAIQLDKNTLFVMAKNTANIVDITSGKIIKSSEIKDNASCTDIDKLILSSDGKAVIVAVNSSDENFILRISTDELKVEAKKAIGNVSFLEGINNENGCIVWESLSWEDFSLINMDYKYHCIDEKTLEEKWTKDAEHFITRMVMYKGKVIAYFSGGIMKLNPENFEISEYCAIDSNISDVTVSGEGLLRLLLTDGSYKLQNTGEFSFFEMTNYHIDQDKLLAYKYVGYKFAALPHRSSSITVYSMQPSSLAEEVEGPTGDNGKLEVNILCKFDNGQSQDDESYAKVEEDGIVIYSGGKEIKKISMSTASVVGAYYDSPSKTILVALNDYSVELRNFEDYSLKNSLVFSYKAYIAPMDEKHFIVGDSSYAYVINRDNLKTEAKLYGYVDYDEKSNSFIIAKSTYDGPAYKVPNIGIKELVDMIKQ